MSRKDNYYDESEDLFENSKKTVTLSILTVILLLIGFSAFSFFNNKRLNEKQVLNTKIADEQSFKNDEQGDLNGDGASHLKTADTNSQEKPQENTTEAETTLNVVKDNENTNNTQPQGENKEETSEENNNETITDKIKGFFTNEEENKNEEAQTQPQEGEEPKISASNDEGQINNKVDETNSIENKEIGETKVMYKNKSWVANDYVKGDISKDTYTIKHGDTLWEIAEGITGEGSNWQKIAQHNNITNGHLIHEGATINIPTSL